jgi:hypothetical protein
MPLKRRQILKKRGMRAITMPMTYQAFMEAYPPVLHVRGASAGGRRLLMAYSG